MRRAGGGCVPDIGCISVAGRDGQRVPDSEMSKAAEGADTPRDENPEVPVYVC